MPYEKTIVCLANSRKHDGLCVAGRVFDGAHFQEWVRPISNRPHEEISLQEQQCADAGGLHLLDVVTVQFLEPRLAGHQQENHLIDANSPWRRIRAIDMATAAGAVETVGGTLWENGNSSGNGLNDRVPEARVPAVRRSLYFVHPQNLVVTAPGPGGGSTRARFALEGHQYRLVVTDPNMERHLTAGDHPMDAFICVSLGEVFEDRAGGRYAYKLIASILPLAGRLK